MSQQEEHMNCNIGEQECEGGFWIPKDDAANLYPGSDCDILCHYSLQQ